MGVIEAHNADRGAFKAPQEQALHVHPSGAESVVVGRPGVEGGVSANKIAPDPGTEKADFAFGREVPVEGDVSPDVDSVKSVESVDEGSDEDGPSVETEEETF